jgi:hypothetical protein
LSRTQVYHAWKMKNQNKAQTRAEARAPVELASAAESRGAAPAPPPKKAAKKSARPQRFFRIPFVRPGDKGKPNIKKGWWFAHFDGQWIARQMELHPEKAPVLLVAGKVRPSSHATCRPACCGSFPLLSCQPLDLSAVPDRIVVRRALISSFDWHSRLRDGVCVVVGTSLRHPKLIPPPPPTHTHTHSVPPRTTWRCASSASRRRVSHASVALKFSLVSSRRSGQSAAVPRTRPHRQARIRSASP